MHIKSFSSVLLTVVPTLMFSGHVAMADNFHSITHMSGAQEVPGVATDGSARATVRFDKGFTRVRINLRFKNLSGNFTRLHFHCNVAGANGPIALGLIDTVTTDFDNSDVVFLSGDRIVGTLTNDNFPPEDACPDAIDRPVNNYRLAGCCHRQRRDLHQLAHRGFSSR